MKISTRRENIHIHLEGEFVLEDAQRDFVEVLKTIESSGLSKILVDGRDITSEPEEIERFFYGVFVAGAVRAMLQRGFEGDKPRFAYVLENPVLDPERLGETVARNRGMDVKAFDNIDEAVSWLLNGREPAREPGE